MERSFWIFGYGRTRTNFVRTFAGGIETIWRRVLGPFYVRVRSVYIPHQVDSTLTAILDRGTQIQMWVEQEDPPKT